MGPHATPGSHQREGKEGERTTRTQDPRRHKPRSSVSAGECGLWHVPARHPAQSTGAGHHVSRRHRSGVPHGVCDSGEGVERVI